MKPTDKRAFSVEMFKLAAALKAPEVSEPMLEAFWEDFADVEIDVFRAVCKKARGALDFMPSIRELRSFLPPRPQKIDPLVERLLAPFLRQEAWPDDDKTAPTVSESVAACLRNAEEAGQAGRRARDAYNRSMPGTDACQDLRLEWRRHFAEKKHWLEYADYYRKQQKRVPLPPPQAAIAKQERETEMDRAIRERMLNMAEEG